jgi:phage shock protein A
MLRKWWNYIKAWFGKKSDEIMDPEIEIEQAIQEAQKRDQDLRNQAAKVIAHRTQVENQLDEAADDLGEAKEMAKQALLKADAAQKAGNADEATRWTDAARTLAMRMQAAQSNVEMLKAQLDTATKQAEQAKQAVSNNAMQLQEISAKRMQMLGQLQSAKMQETVNKAMDSLNASVGDTSAPSLDEVEKKIEARLAEASAHAELKAATPEGAVVDLKQAVNLTKADDALDSLRAELGLSASGALAPATASAPPPPPPPPPSA